MSRNSSLDAMTSVPLVPLVPLSRTTQAVADKLGRSFAQYGFAMVSNHGLNNNLIERSWDLARELFSQSDAQKRRYILPDGAGARGYTPFGTEIAKDAASVDLKEFWHVGRDLPPGHPLCASMQSNIWPDMPADFQSVLSQLYEQLDAVGAKLLAAIALQLGLEKGWFDDAIRDGDSVLRLLHYPPVPAGAQGLRAAPHEDINLITLLLGAEEAGLEIQGENGEWIAINPPPGALVVNVGDMLQRLTNDRLRSTTHRVRNPDAGRAGRSRYSMPFFVHLCSDFLIETLSQCIDADHPDRYPEPILAGDYLHERLVEIGLIKDT